MNARCHYGFFAFLLVVLAAACMVDPSPQNAAALGRRYSATIPGTWSGTVASDGLTIQMVKTYRSDGSVVGVLLIKETRGAVSLVMPEVRFRSRWRVVGDIIETYDTEATAPGMFKRGEVIRDRIISVNDNRIISRSESDGLIQVLVRLDPQR